MRKIVVLVAIAVLGATSNRVMAAEAPPEGRMVAIGDSYTAGEGVPPFVAHTDLAGINECHRSSRAYPVQVASRLGLPLESWACSGAATADLVTTTVSRERAPWNDPLHELAGGTSASALDRLGSDVSVVTLSIGGNDVGFADIVSDCLVSPDSCTSNDAAVDRDLAVLDGTLDALFADMAGRLASQAQVLVVGYPRAFPSNPHADCDFIPLLPIGTFTVAEQQWANARTADVNEAVQRATEGADAGTGPRFRYVDTWDAFAGRELCRPDPSSGRPLASSPVLNGVDLINFEHSFHPSAAGHRVLADRVLAARGVATDAAHTVGLVDPGLGLWRLRGAAGGEAGFYFGNPGDVPVVGDWDCDGIETPGMYRQSDGFVYLRNSNTQGVADIRFFFGNPGDVPIVGDFNGDGCHTVSIYRPGESRVFVINRLGDDDGGLGAAEVAYVFGNPGDQPFVGDFDGDGVETVGLHRASTGLVYFRNSHTEGVADLEFIFGDPGDRLIAGDWTGDGIDTPAVFRPGDTTFYFRDSNTQGVADDQFSWGEPSSLPVAGHFGPG